MAMDSDAYNDAIATEETFPLSGFDDPKIAERLRLLHDFPNSSPTSKVLKSVIVRAPGRVNLLGEHVDYSGFGVLPMALAQYDVSIRIREVEDEGDEWVRISNVDPSFEQRSYNSGDPRDLSIDLDNHHWSHYFLAGFLGAFDAMKGKSAFPSAFKKLDVLISGNVPSGAGLSSSAALVVSSVLSVCAIYGLRITRKELAMAAIEGGASARLRLLGSTC